MQKPRNKPHFYCLSVFEFQLQLPRQEQPLKEVPKTLKTAEQARKNGATGKAQGHQDAPASKNLGDAKDLVLIF
jgi:hypothetical protein